MLLAGEAGPDPLKLLMYASSLRIIRCKGRCDTKQFFAADNGQTNDNTDVSCGILVKKNTPPSGRSVDS